MTTTSTDSEILKETTQNLNAFARYWQSINWDHILSLFIEKSISIILFTILFFFLNRIGKKAIHRTYLHYRQKQNVAVPRVKTLRTLIDNIFSYTLFFIYLYTVLTILGIPIGSLIAGAGIAGLAIGLGAQGLMNDIITGFFILLEQQFDIGDYIRLQNINIEGTVTAFGLRTTQLRSRDGVLHYIPNRNITTISNQSRYDMRAFVDIPVFPTSDFEKINDVLSKVNQEVKAASEMITDGPTILGLTELTPTSFVYRTSLYTKNGQQTILQELLLKKQMDALKEAEISIPGGVLPPKQN